MNTRPPLLNPNRTARLISWAVAMLSWIALVLCGERFANRRHIRQRYGFVSLAWLKQLLGALAIARVAEMLTDRRAPSRTLRNTAPACFRRRINRAGMSRAILGSRLRKALAAPTPHGRISRLIAAFRDLDGFTRRYLLPRALRRLTKLCAIIMVAPPAQCAASLGLPLTPACADTS
ncbi:MAG: hypothetical protein KF779_02305 [Hyphomonadaceae bacterium]|nr:hypothetical protein [Hyphomonadaceae bacterium]